MKQGGDPRHLLSLKALSLKAQRECVLIGQWEIWASHFFPLDVKEGDVVASSGA